MKKLLATLVLAGLCSTAAAAGIHVKDQWARATVEGMKMGGAFMNIHNDNKKQDFLLGGSSPVAERVEVHTHVNDNGVMRMREVKGGVPLGAGDTTELKPGSYHIMFMGLKRPLKEGETIPVTLKFKHSKAQTIDIPVKNAPKPTAHRHNHGAAHQH
ncbi:copper chaperone PCu(A)C [Neisseria animalis]|uniref:Copper chaperone PCu(A)C n=1 Tax=Neisseria animalis TaxID=492 RepID=A0A5P3MS41_NEIAN|nr:copper chaperone PCu(A)C [Neisseria animalis]QEY24413.1 copper chaperone PCu(A)C [Neisseria animalis]ROW31889.1 copper chaperone PCu(A)C [Neisseria animalis]VEE07004.1 Uncharacterized protein conserved in bacteria [Neisseria animalis]